MAGPTKENMFDPDQPEGGKTSWKSDQFDLSNQEQKNDPQHKISQNG